jgi:hypothetical protein
MSLHHIAGGVEEAVDRGGPVVCNLAAWFGMPDRGYQPSPHRERKARQQERLKREPLRIKNGKGARSVSDPRREGFHDPIYCPRGREDCKSLAQIVADGHVSFICCGENNGHLVRVPTDRYRFCHKTAEGVDVLMDHDQRDMAHIAAVYSMALAAVLSPTAGHDAPSTLHQNEERGV